jgi:glyoxylase-like metal-dependent hydrolase (beta-lactamase superfamily II)
MKRIALLLLALAGSAQAQQDFSQVQIKTTPLGQGLYVLEGRGGNIGVSHGPDGFVLIDDQYAPLTPKIRAALKAIGREPVRFVLNTHWHGDHTGGNETFGTEATLIAQTNVRKRLSTEQTLRGEKVPAIKPEGWPVITYDQSISLHWNGEEVKVFHLPHGHTDGDSIIYFTGSNVVHTGDDFFVGRFPFVDLESGGSVEGLIGNIEKLIGLLPEDIKIIPGHGPLSTKADLEAYHAMLTETTSLVRQGMAAGKSLDDLKKAGLPEKYKSLGTGFINAERWIETIHASLGQGKAPAPASTKH